MLQALCCALRRHRWLALLGGGSLLSSLGNGLTFILVYHALLHLAAPASSLALAYLLATLPGWLGSWLGERLSTRIPPFGLLMLGEVLGLCGLLLPLGGLRLESIPLLLLAQACSAFTLGITWPAWSLIVKRGLSPGDLPAATALETLVFAAHVLLGVGVGVLLLRWWPPQALLLLDALSFVACLGVLACARRAFPQPDKPQPLAPAAALPPLSLPQRRSLWLLPLLAMVGAPAMALLPALAPMGDGGETALGFLFARSLGQLIGPLVIPARQIARLSGDNRLIAACLALFVACYLLLPWLPARGLAWPLIVLAHIASNVVFALATFSLLSHFPATQTTTATALAYRRQTLAAGTGSLLAALLADHMGAPLAVAVLGIGGWLAAVGWLAGRRENVPG
ncbi:hypothetical protein CYR55_19315 [Chimaeribacter californicus]|uniref:MFS transporter n=1 Tax=Chimaeribacter californicus TaxID=2060067 RepID=A0A2N5DXG1_9GAMM|nr:MFS transporter [Chimaeribacter californicus]PLR32053.1 hypothetical protein CYR55_19315 [Chimaeribacter californicus]